MRKMCILEKLNFKISRGTMPPDPLVYERQRRSILFLPDYELLLPGLLFPRAIVSIVLRILPTQKDFSFLSKKRCTFRIDIYFKDC